jgi:hypothetical protein
MAQMTIYLDDETAARVERAARTAKSSVSAWIKERLTEALDERWPAGYFDLFGSLKDAGLERPAQPEPHTDAKRDPL